MIRGIKCRKRDLHITKFNYKLINKLKNDTLNWLLHV